MYISDMAEIRRSPVDMVVFPIIYTVLFHPKATFCQPKSLVKSQNHLPSSILEDSIASSNRISDKLL